MVRFAACHESSGTYDQAIETAVSAASPANATSVMPPFRRPPRLARSSPTATSRPPARTSAISVQVTRSSWKPPLAANETAAKTAPSAALAAEEAYRDTARLGPAQAQHGRSGDGGHRRQRRECEDERQREVVRVGAVRGVQEAAGRGGELAVPHRHRRRGVAAGPRVGLAPQRVEVLLARGHRAARGVGRGVRGCAAGGTAAAPTAVAAAAVLRVEGGV